MNAIYSQNALDPTWKISYAEGRVVKADHTADRITVSVNGETLSDLPIVYESADGRPSSYAFSNNDSVVVRLYEGVPSHIIGFKEGLWPFVPMPADTYETATGMMSSGLFTQTGYIRSEKTLFKEIYRLMPRNSCDITQTNYIDQPVPADMTGQLYAVQQHRTTNVYSRLTRMYYGDELIYETYNEETFSGVFNGTRSNIIGAYKDPVSEEAFVIYQINTFTDWLPRTSGRVDFDFYVYSSLGVHQKLASAYSTITGASSPVYGECFNYYANGFYSEDETDTSIFICGFYICSVAPFTASNNTNVVAPSSTLQYVRFIHSWSPEGYDTALTVIPCAEDGTIELSGGEYAEPDLNLYCKKR